MTLQNNKHTFFFSPWLFLGLCLLISFAVLFFNGNKQIARGLDKESKSKTAQTMPNLNSDEAEEFLKENGLYKSLGEAMKASRYSIYPTKNAPLPKHKEAFEANNPKQAFSTYFAKDGIHLVSKVKNNKWRVQMNLKGYGYGEEITKVKQTKAEVQKRKSRIELTKSAIANPQTKIIEWYENKSDGLEQGWTINEKLETDSNKDELKLVLDIDGDLNPNLTADNQAITFKNKKGKSILQYDKLKSWDANGKELASRMDLSDRELSIIVDDSEAKYPITIDPLFSYTRKITASDAAIGDKFGYSVSISGNTAIIGAYGNDDNGGSSGSAYIFERNEGGANIWGEVKKLTASDGAGSDYFGLSVSISGSNAIVGAYRNDDNGSNSGSAYIFSRNSGGADNWGEVKKITASDAAAHDYFGYSVGISDDTAIVGAYGNDYVHSLEGSAYIFEKNEGGADNWGEVKKLTASDAAFFDSFGTKVAISGDTAIVSSPKNSDAGGLTGSAYIFERNSDGAGGTSANNWGEVKKLTASDAAANSYFGFSVAISEDQAIVGAFSHDDVGTNSGAAYVFERNEGGADNWGEVKKLTASDAASGDEFGISVSISQDTVIVGARFDDDWGSNSGSAYIFERNEGGADNWGQSQKLTVKLVTANDNFGFSVGISDDTAIIGAYQEVDHRGSAYIFTNQNNNWVEITKKTASDAVAYDSFGSSVAISGNVAIVGAAYNDDDGNDSGSAYIFERNTGGVNIWGEVRKLIASDATAGDNFGISVGISVNTVIVGARDNNNGGGIGSGSAYIFNRNTGGANNWGEEKKISASDAAAHDNFGESVGISGDTVIVGAYSDDDHGGESGSAYIFKRNFGGTNNWGEVKKLTASDASTLDSFGRSVGISEDTAIVGSDHPNTGVIDSAYIFYRNSGGANNWGEVKKLTNPQGSSQYGRAVAISGDTVVIGDYSRRTAYVYDRNSGGADNWGEVKSLNASDTFLGDAFATSVAISGNKIIVGATRDDDNGYESGSAYIFDRNMGGVNNWGETQKLIPSDGASGDRFGSAVGVSGNTAIIGANGSDDNGAYSGSVYIFEIQ